jgi:prepilin-type N-terminal cleavage/methylation domain-containing protein
MRKKGFTLIELLVVISIIALLLSILLPGLRKAKESAKATLCMNNQKQMGLFFAMYSEENDQELIETCDWAKRATEATTPARWADMLFYDYKVVDSSEVFYCPASKVPEGIDKKWGSEYEFAAIVPSSGLTETHASYTYGLRPGAFNWSHANPLKLDNLNSPSSYFLLTDVTYPGNYSPAYPPHAPELAGSHYYIFDAWHSFFMIHRKGLNVLSADMSVSQHKVDSVLGTIRRDETLWFVDPFPAIVFPDGTMLDSDGTPVP